MGPVYRSAGVYRLAMSVLEGREGAARRRLIADFGPKVLAEDASGYEKLLDANPGNARLHDAAAAIFLRLQNTNRAVAHLTEALRVDPDFVSAHYNLATALVRLDRPNEAVEHLRRAVQLRPDFVAARVNLGASLRLLKRYDEATTELRLALQLQRGNAVAHANLGGIFSAEGRPREAIAEYRLALDANPDLLEPLAALAWTLATSPDAGLRQPAEAVRLAERAATLTNRRDVTVLDALAAAYASAGRFVDAVDRHGVPSWDTADAAVSREWNCRARIIGAGADEAYALRSWRLSLSPTVLRPP